VSTDVAEIELTDFAEPELPEEACPAAVEPPLKGWAKIKASPLIDNPLLLGVAGIGFAVSFQTVSHEAAAHGLPGYPALYPIGIDVGILALMNEARKLLARDRSDLVPRALAWALSLGTVYVNVHGSPPRDWLGRTLHAIMPALWIVFLELTRWRQRADIKRAEKADPVPLARWVLDPWGTMKLKRRMVLNNILSYRLACALEDARKHMRDLVRAHYGGRWGYWHDAPALLRANIRKGRLGDEVTTAVATAVGEGRTGGWESAVIAAVTTAAVQGNRLATAISHERDDPAGDATRESATHVPPVEATPACHATGTPAEQATPRDATSVPPPEATPSVPPERAIRGSHPRVPPGEATRVPAGRPAALDREATAQEARRVYRESVAAGTPLSRRALARMFDRERTWAKNRIDEVTQGPQLAEQAI
jgi:Protein of unknown function (DUF2637)